MTVSYNHRNII